MDSIFLSIFIELLVGFIALFLATKFLGKTQISQLTPFDFISALVLGELVGNALYNPDTNIIHIIYAIILWTAFIYLTELSTQKSLRLRRFFEGEPSILIAKGIIRREALRKNYLDLNQLQHLLRSKDVFSIQDVDYAILETDGTINVLKKSSVLPPTREELRIQKSEEDFGITLISDGELLPQHLTLTGKDEAWLLKQLKARGIIHYADVFYAEYVPASQELYVQSRWKDKQK